MGKSLTTADILRLENEEFFFKTFKLLLGTVATFSNPADFSKYGSIRMCGFKDPSRRIHGIMCDLLAETSDGKYFIQRYITHFCEDVLLNLPLEAYKILTDKSSVKKTSFIEDIMLKKLVDVTKSDIRKAEQEVLFMSKFQSFLLDQKNFPLKVPVVYVKIVTFNDEALEKLSNVGLRKSYK